MLLPPVELKNRDTLVTPIKISAEQSMGFTDPT